MPTTKRVCVTGAGSSGLAAIAQLLDADLEVLAFEARTDCGGAWRCEDDAGECHVVFDDQGRAVATGSRDSTSMYSSFRTNVPSTLMAFRGRPFPPSTPLFPDPSTVQAYLKRVAHEVRNHIQYNSRVTNLRYTKPEDEGEQRKWFVEVTSTVSKEATSTTKQVDLVVIANGHYTLPWIPTIPGLAEWTGTILDARWYRGPEVFLNKNVLVVGNATSGYDVTREIASLIYEKRAEGEINNTYVAQSARSAPTLAMPFDSPRLTRLTMQKTSNCLEKSLELNRNVYISRMEFFWMTSTSSFSPPDTSSRFHLLTLRVRHSRVIL